MEEATPPTIHHVIGLNLRALREGSQLSQEALAATAREVGLPWTGTMVAKVERGERTVAAEELFLAAVTLNVRVADLLEGEGFVALTEDAHYRLDLLRDMARGRSLDEVRTRLGVAALLRRPAQSVDSLIAEFGEHKEVPAVGESYLHEHLRERRDDAVQRAARRLGVGAGSVVVTAHRLWKRGLVAEREARLAGEGASEIDASTRQALRGHVTRQLLAELDTALKANKAKPKAGKKKGSR